MKTSLSAAECSRTSFHLTFDSSGQVLEVDGTDLSWATLQVPSGDVPSLRHGHCACEFPECDQGSSGTSSGINGLLVFGGEGRVDDTLEIRPTYSHESFLYDPEVSPSRLICNHPDDKGNVGEARSLTFLGLFTAPSTL